VAASRAKSPGRGSHWRLNGMSGDEQRVSGLYGVRWAVCCHRARTLCEAFCDRAGEQNYDERLAWYWLSENRAPVKNERERRA
jgi:hypothetical protein